MAKHKIYLLHDTCFDYIVLPKNRSRVGIGNTWNDNGLFQPNGNVFDFIIHYRWNGFFHFCKFQAINYNSRLACGFIGENFYKIPNLLLTSQLNSADTTADDDILRQWVECSTSEGFLSVVLGYIYYDQLARR